MKQVFIIHTLTYQQVGTNCWVTRWVGGLLRGWEKLIKILNDLQAQWDLSSLESTSDDGCRANECELLQIKNQAWVGVGVGVCHGGVNGLIFNYQMILCILCVLFSHWRLVTVVGCRHSSSSRLIENCGGIPSPIRCFDLSRSFSSRRVPSQPHTPFSPHRPRRSCEIHSQLMKGSSRSWSQFQKRFTQKKMTFIL